MAKLQAHGRELYRWEGAAFKKVYMSDGTILKNNGYGWKVSGKIKAEFTPQEVADRARARYAQMKKDRPALFGYVQIMRQIGGSLKNRRLLTIAFDYMPEDPDGVWAELDSGWETRGRYTFDDINQIYRADLAAIEEQKTINNQ